MDAALSVPELLESILLHLDTQTLLTSAQRTSKTWHDLIQTSPSLQKALFLQPDDDDDDRNNNNFLRHSPSPATPVLNDLLVKNFPFCFPQARQESRPGSGGAASAAASAAVLRPISRNTDTATLNATSFPRSEHIARRARAFARRDASWRRMLIQQPPLRGYGVVMTACVPASRDTTTTRNTTTRAAGPGGGEDGVDAATGEGEEEGDHGNENDEVQDTRTTAAGVTPGQGPSQEILLMPSPTLRSSGPPQTQGDRGEDPGEVITMPFLVEKCLTAPQQPAREDQDVSISGFRVFWNTNTNTNTSLVGRAAAAADETDACATPTTDVVMVDGEASKGDSSRVEAVAAATFPGNEGAQVRAAVTHQAQQHGMVLNAVVGLMKLAPVNPELRRVREILLGGEKEDSIDHGAQHQERKDKVMEEVLDRECSCQERDICSNVGV